MIVLIPTFASVVLYVLIYQHVRSSSRRVLPSIEISRIDSNYPKIFRIPRRDTQLLRRMIVMFVIFIGGWSPLYISAIILPDISSTFLTFASFTLLAKFSLLVDIINLYLHNPQIARYLRNVLFKCSFTQHDI